MIKIEFQEGDFGCRRQSDHRFVGGIGGQIVHMHLIAFGIKQKGKLGMESEPAGLIEAGGL